VVLGGFVNKILNCFILFFGIFLDRPFKFAFTVIKQLDLNYENPALCMPAKMEMVKTFYCGLCQTKPLYLAAIIPYSGYVPGQEITVSVDVNNESRVDINYLKISLKKIIRYTPQPTSMVFKEETLTEVEIRCGEIFKRSKEKFIRNLLIPPVPPSNSNYCKILTVRYEVQVKCKVSAPSASPVLNFPIVIGTGEKKLSIFLQIF
jgi:Arrestin (or S-antigen), C-terminal domain